MFIFIVIVDCTFSWTEMLNSLDKKILHEKDYRDILKFGPTLSRYSKQIHYQNDAIV